jgi:hypothetical protein
MVTPSELPTYRGKILSTCTRIIYKHDRRTNGMTEAPSSLTDSQLELLP